VLYRLYQDEPALDAAYGEVRRFVRRQVRPELTGTRCQDGNYGGTWAQNEVEMGKLICVTIGGNTESLWSDTRTGLLGLAAIRTATSMPSSCSGAQWSRTRDEDGRAVVDRGRWDGRHAGDTS
jgi:hypothetical protein